MTELFPRRPPRHNSIDGFCKNESEIMANIILLLSSMEGFLKMYLFCPFNVLRKTRSLSYFGFFSPLYSCGWIQFVELVSVWVILEQNNFRKETKDTFLRGYICDKNNRVVMLSNVID